MCLQPLRLTLTLDGTGLPRLPLCMHKLTVSQYDHPIVVSVSRESQGNPPVVLRFSSGESPVPVAGTMETEAPRGAGGRMEAFNQRMMSSWGESQRARDLRDHVHERLHARGSPVHRGVCMAPAPWDQLLIILPSLTAQKWSTDSAVADD